MKRRLHLLWLRLVWLLVRRNYLRHGSLYVCMCGDDMAEEYEAHDNHSAVSEVKHATRLWWQARMPERFG